MTDEKATYTHPQKIVAAGALFTNKEGKILLVNPSYKWQWEIPGGVVEQYETPLAGCIREVKEELDLDVRPERLLGVDHMLDRSRPIEVLRFIFWGGELGGDDIATIRLPQDNELTEFGFFTIAEAQSLLTDALGKQLRQTIDALKNGGVAYGEHIYK